MSLSQEKFDQIAELTELYLLDEITADQLAALEALVRGDDDAAQAMRAILKQAGTMRVVFAEQRKFTYRIGEVDRDEFLALLQTLSPTEEPELVHLVAQPKTHRPLWQQWQFVIPSAMAALLAIAVILIVMVPTGTPSTGTLDIAQVPDKPAESAPPILRDQPVATLTATHNATWAGTPAERALARGSELEPGQRLTLTAGFAEITTHDGAVAILEAPATIEFIDSDNAIRLHAGKLVGICETDSSKGFIVRTPHMDITDLGTRFGVDSNRRVTEVHVFEGEVQARSNNAAPNAAPTLLVANQSARTSADTDVIARIDHSTDRFAALLPTTTQLPGAGHGRLDGQLDPNWLVVSVGGQPINPPAAMQLKKMRDTNQQHQRWLIFLPDRSPTEQAPTLTFEVQTTLELPTNWDPQKDRLVINYGADDRLTAIHINGSRFVVPRSEAYTIWSIVELHDAQIDKYLRPGRNTIRFEVEDQYQDASRQNAIGLFVRWRIERVQEPISTREPL